MNQVTQLRLAVSQSKPPHRLHHNDRADLPHIELKSHGRFTPEVASLGLDNPNPFEDLQL